eukprot:m51a1_g8907 hypothetical protein (430) ;mRNA; f:760513-765136
MGCKHSREWSLCAVALAAAALCCCPAWSSSSSTGSVSTWSTWETPVVISAGAGQQGSWVWLLRDSDTAEATGTPTAIDDVNGDGIADFAYNVSLGPRGSVRQGVVIVFGTTGGFDNPLRLFDNGVLVQDAALCCSGDINGDRIADLVLQASGRIVLLEGHRGDIIGGKSYTLIPAGKRDTEFVVELYQRCPVPGFDLARVEIIYSPHLEQAFENRVAQLQARVGNPAFAPGYEREGNRATRAAVRERLMEMARRTPEAAYPNVKVVAMWHGTRAEALESVFRAGFASLATTDEGFFGKGVYSAYEARYASEVYSRGALLVNWVSLFSAFPVVDGDMARLTGKGSYANYDAHFIPVRPASAAAGEQNYVACTELSQAVFHELVTFEASQNLPRYLVTLQPRMVQTVPALSSSRGEMISREAGPKPQQHCG